MIERVVELSELTGQGVLEVGAGRPRSVGYPLPILRVADVLDGKIETSIQDSVQDDYRQEWGPKVSMPGDIVLTTKGTVGRVAIMPLKGPHFAYSPQLCYFRPRADGPLNSLYLYYWLKSEHFRAQADALKSQTDMADFLSLSDIQALKLKLPSLEHQAAVTELLGALDDKITANDRVTKASRDLGMALFDETGRTGSKTARVESIACYLNRGQAPKYTDDEDSIVVINQKCVRKGRVDLGPARRTVAERVQVGRRLTIGDVLVNSTGVGTLGRVGIWSHDVAATVDSHVTIVRIDPTVIPPIIGAFGMLRAQSAIEVMGEGSTGQTELSRAKLGVVEISLPSMSQQWLADKLNALEAKAHRALLESRTLAALRDTLLPQLMTGQLRVRDAERFVEDAI